MLNEYVFLWKKIAQHLRSMHYSYYKKKATDMMLSTAVPYNEQVFVMIKSIVFMDVCPITLHL